MTAPELSPEEAAIVAKFDAAPELPEAYVAQHRMNPGCWCGPIRVGENAWRHRG